MTAKRKIGQENQEFKMKWTESFAFVENSTGFRCLICHANLSNNKKANIQRHFLNRHDTFPKSYSDEDERKKAKGRATTQSKPK